MIVCRRSPKRRSWAFAEGDEKSPENLAEQAKRVDETALRDVHEELEEDAASEHDPEKPNQSMPKNSPI
jgi:hypothetical protein